VKLPHPRLRDEVETEKQKHDDLSEKMVWELTANVFRIIWDQCFIELQGFNLTTQSSGSEDDTTRPLRQGL
jgi:hypothetical protein